LQFQVIIPLIATSGTVTNQWGKHGDQLCADT
jgi:hypothetical protein